MSLLIIFLSWLLLTAGMACFGLVYLSMLKETIERGNLIEEVK